MCFDIGVEFKKPYMSEVKREVAGALGQIQKCM